MTRRPAGVVLALVAVLAACGGAETTGEIGRSNRVPDRGAIELTLRTPAGEFVDVGDLRGAPTLLFLFATFDGVSQASLRSLRRFTLRHPEVHVVGVGVQPDASQLVGPWADALQVQFTVTYEPEERIAIGLSPLGAFDAVPTFIMLDAQGFEVGRHVGFASDRKLETLLERAMPSAGVSLRSRP